MGRTRVTHGLAAAMAAVGLMLILAGDVAGDVAGRVAAPDPDTHACMQVEAEDRAQNLLD